MSSLHFLSTWPLKSGGFNGGRHLSMMAAADVRAVALLALLLCSASSEAARQLSQGAYSFPSDRCPVLRCVAKAAVFVQIQPFMAATVLQAGSPGRLAAPSSRPRSAGSCSRT